MTMAATAYERSFCQALCQVVTSVIPMTAQFHTVSVSTLQVGTLRPGLSADILWLDEWMV